MDKITKKWLNIGLIESISKPHDRKYIAAVMELLRLKLLYHYVFKSTLLRNKVGEWAYPVIIRVYNLNNKTIMDDIFLNDLLNKLITLVESDDFKVNMEKYKDNKKVDIEAEMLCDFVKYNYG
tara:strand:- start:4920 stop:5288 length:369 start_codon:yes stop_codon:yes gene_type:complete